jgi:hypothetical protein
MIRPVSITLEKCMCYSMACASCGPSIIFEIQCTPRQQDLCNGSKDRRGLRRSHGRGSRVPWSEAKKSSPIESIQAKVTSVIGKTLDGRLRVTSLAK